MTPTHFCPFRPGTTTTWSEGTKTVTTTTPAPCESTCRLAVTLHGMQPGTWDCAIRGIRQELGMLQGDVADLLLGLTPARGGVPAPVDG